MNVVLDKNQALQRARHFDLIYPIFWFEAGIDQLPSGIVSQLQMAQTLPPMMKKIFLIVMCFFTVVFLVLLTAQTFFNMCKSGLSSIKSKSPRSSMQDTRSTTPDLESVSGGSDHQGDTIPSNDDSNQNSYTAFTSPRTLDSEGMGRLIDNHTLLPAYRQRDPSGAKKNRVTGTSSDATDFGRQEPGADANEYPPDYQTVATDVQSRLPPSAAPPVASNDSFNVMEHKSISATHITHETPRRTANKIPDSIVAPLASIEDLTAQQKTSQQPPLATSSPQQSADDIDVNAEVFRNPEDVNFTLDAEDDKTDAADGKSNRRHTIPIQLPNSVAHNSSLPPPLESDL